MPTFVAGKTFSYREHDHKTSYEHEGKRMPGELSHLEALIATGKLKRVSKVVTLLDPHKALITKAAGLGHPALTIQEALEKDGVKVSPEALRRYLEAIGVRRIKARKKT